MKQRKLMEKNHKIEEEHNKFPAWIWIVISGVFIWAFIFAPFNLLNP